MMNLTARNSYNKKDAKALSINIDLLCTKFSSLRCQLHPSHGSYDFICTAPNSPCDKLICADCLKQDPKHIQAHGAHFLRPKDFLQKFSHLSLDSESKQLVSDMKQQELRYIEIIKLFEKDKRNGIADLRDYFSNFEKSLLEVIKQGLRSAEAHLVSQFEQCCQQQKINMKSIIFYTKKLTRYLDYYFITDLGKLLGKNAQQDKIREFISNLVEMKSNSKELFRDWYQKLSPGAKTPSKEFKPGLKMRHLKLLSQDIETRVAEVLKEFLHIENKEIFKTKKNLLGEEDFKLNLSNLGQTWDIGHSGISRVPNEVQKQYSVDDLVREQTIEDISIIKVKFPLKLGKSHPRKI